MTGMYGKGILKGLKVSFLRFVDTYLDDLRWIGKRYRTPQGIAHRGSKGARGIFTVQYPEEKIPVPEEFRFLPFLVYNEGPNGEKNLLCTSCGICSTRACFRYASRQCSFGSPSSFFSRNSINMRHSRPLSFSFLQGF